MAWLRRLSASRAADARQALAELPKYLPLPDAWTRKPLFDEPIGRAFLLAGRTAEALPFLERAANACMALEYPIDRLWARLELADAFEASSKRESACGAYQRVTVTRPVNFSRTTQIALAHAAALGCDRK